MFEPQARAAPWPEDEQLMSDSPVGPTAGDAAQSSAGQSDAPDPGFDGVTVDAPQAHPAPSDAEGIILGFAAQEASGCLTITNASGDEGLVWFRDGQVYAASVPGRRPLLGVRLVTAGAISPDQLNAALELQRSEMHTARLGEVLVHLRLVNRRVIEAFALEQQRDMLADLLGWAVTNHWFRNGARTRTDLAPFTDVADLIEQAHARQRQWPIVVDEIGGADVVPLPTGTVPHATLSSSERTVLGYVDGLRTLVDIADDCGYTLFEAADIILGLAAEGLVTTATDLLHDPRPTGFPSLVDDPFEPLAEVLPLHLVTEDSEESAPVYDDSPRFDSPSFDSPSFTEVEPAAFIEAPVIEALEYEAPYEPIVESIPLTAEPALTFEPAVTDEPLPSTFSQLPPPSAEPFQSTDGEQNVEPADTAALMRELTSLGLRDDK